MEEEITVAHSMVELLAKRDTKVKKPWPWPDSYTLKLEEFISAIINKKSTAPAGAAPVTIDSESNAMLKAHAYKAQTAGFAYARVFEGNVEVKGYVGSTDNPAGAGTHLVSNGSSSTANSGITIFVPKDLYFEFTSTGTVTIAWGSLIAGGGAPIDQD